MKTSRLCQWDICLAHAGNCILNIVKIPINRTSGHLESLFIIRNCTWFESFVFFLRKNIFFRLKRNSYLFSLEGFFYLERPKLSFHTWFL